MAEEATVTVFKIETCGYYDVDGRTHRLATVDEVFDDLKAWLSDKSLGDTCTYEVQEDQPFLRTFCVDLLSDSDTLLFVTWNESDRSIKGVKSINENDSVGKASVKTVSLGKDDIPGYPAFFWVIPALSLAINIRFDDRLNGSRPFQHFIRGFLSDHSKWCVYDERSGDGEVPLLGYAKSPRSTPKEYEVKFSTAINHRGGEIAYLRNNAEKIIRLIRKKYLRVRCAEDNDLMTRLLVAARIKNTKVTSLYNKVRYEIPFKPDADAVDQLIDSWSDEQEKGDIGFRLKGESGHVYWLGRSLSRDKMRLGVKRKGDGMIESESLLKALTKARGEILSLRD